MTILIGHFQLQSIFTQLTISVSSLKTLIIRADEAANSGFDRMLPSARLTWLQSLREMDIRGVDFHILYDFSNTSGSLPNLMTLKCPIRVAIQLIKYVLTPQLRKLTIVESHPAAPRMDRHKFEDLIILATNDEIIQWPELNCLVPSGQRRYLAPSAH